MNFLFLATFFRGLEAEKSWERVRLKIVIIIIGRKRGRAERERERLAVEPTLENIDYKRSSLLQTIMLDDDYHNFYQSPQKNKNGQK